MHLQFGILPLGVPNHDTFSSSGNTEKRHQQLSSESSSQVLLTIVAKSLLGSSCKSKQSQEMKGVSSADRSVLVLAWSHVQSLEPHTLSVSS